MNKLFFVLLSASMTSAVICNEAVAETEKDKAVVAEAVVETTATKKSKCANCPCTDATQDKSTSSAIDCPCEEAGASCECPSMQAE